MKTKEELSAYFQGLGFKVCDAEEQVKDLGLSRDWLVYLKRVYQGQFQYVWLTFHEGSFVGSILSVYSKPYNSRAKPGMTPVHIYIYRDILELTAAVEKAY
jgi:hypothetical protein